MKTAGPLNPGVRVAVRVGFALYCSILLILTSALPAYAFLVREPYLQLVTPTSITIVWRTDLSGGNDSQVQYGADSGNLDQTATGFAAVPVSNPSVEDHFVTITGLSPGTKYFYNVGTTSGGVEGGGTAEHYFVYAVSTYGTDVALV